MRFKIFLLFAVVVFDSISGLLSSEFFPSLEYPFRIIALAGDATILVLGALVVYRTRTYYGTKAFVLFAFLSFVTVLYHFDSLGIVSQLNGLRQPLLFLAAMVFIHDIVNSNHWPSFSKMFSKYLLGYALVQVPVSVWQFLKYGAGDPVGGTYGLTGGSGLITQQVFLISFYIIARTASSPDGSNFVIRRAVPLLLLLIPCALNETKIAFVLLPVYIVLLAVTKKHWYKTIPFMVVGGILVFLLNYYYTKTAEDTSKILDVNFAEKYLYYNTQENDLPRFARIPIMFRLMDYDPLLVSIGLGYGLFLGNDVLGVTQLSRSLRYLQGSRILLFTSWIQGGIFATLILGFASTTFIRSPYVRVFTLRRFRYFLFFSIALSWMYNEALFDRVFALMAAYLIVWTESGGDAVPEDSTATVLVEELQHEKVS